MEEQNKYDLFDRYLRGELGEKELDDFLEELKSNEELREEFDQYQYLVEGIREHEKQELKGFMVKNARNRFIGSPWSTAFTYASAAIIIGFGLLYVVLDNLNLKKEGITVNNPVEVPKREYHDQTGQEDEGAEEEREEEKEQVAEYEQQASVNEVDTSHLVIVEDEPKAEIQADQTRFPEMGDQNRMARTQSEDEFPVKEDSRIMDTLFTLAIRFEEPDKQPVDTTEIQDKKEALNVVSEKILVQFWKSPINYKGYRFDGRKLVLFGLDTVSMVELKYRVIDHDLKVYDIYLVYGNLHVKLVDNNRYNAYIRETNPVILKELK